MAGRAKDAKSDRLWILSTPTVPPRYPLLLLLPPLVLRPLLSLQVAQQVLLVAPSHLWPQLRLRLQW